MAEDSKYVSGNRFYILGGFDDDLQEGVVIPLTNKIDELGTVKDASIDIYINSYGGNAVLCMHLVHLVDLAKAKGITVRTIVPQMAFSAGSMLAIAGTKGERYISDTAEHLIHYGTQGGWHTTTPVQIERQAEHKKRWFKTCLEHYKRYANVPDLEEQIKDDDFFITAKDAIKWGLADKYMNEL